MTSCQRIDNTNKTFGLPTFGRLIFFGATFTTFGTFEISQSRAPWSYKKEE